MLVVATEGRAHVKLLQAPRSPFCVKVRLVIAELGLGENVRLVDVDPWTDESLRRLNPICKVPTLLLKDGSALHDSPVICEFLNAYAGGRLIPASGPARWRILCGQATADGLAEAVIRRHVEGLSAPTDRSQAVRRRQELAIAAALAAIEAGVLVRPDQTSLAEFAAIAAIHYLDRRSPEIAWRKSHASLAEWFDDQIRHPRTVAALAPA